MARRGCQTPTYSWCDSYDRTEGRQAVELSRVYGMPPHPWQASILNDWLALDDDGRLLDSLCVLEVPRQNGKTGVCDPRETWGLVKRGESDSAHRAGIPDGEEGVRPIAREVRRLQERPAREVPGAEPPHRQVHDEREPDGPRPDQRRAHRVPNTRQLHADGARRNVRPRGRGRGPGLHRRAGRRAVAAQLGRAARLAADHPHGHGARPQARQRGGGLHPPAQDGARIPRARLLHARVGSPRFAGRRGRPRSVVRDEPLARIPIARERPAQRFQVDDGREVRDGALGLVPRDRWQGREAHQRRRVGEGSDRSPAA